jgi:hypothetical protein
MNNELNKLVAINEQAQAQGTTQRRTQESSSCFSHRDGQGRLRYHGSRLGDIEIGTDRTDRTRNAAHQAIEGTGKVLSEVIKDLEQDLDDTKQKADNLERIIESLRALNERLQSIEGDRHED